MDYGDPRALDQMARKWSPQASPVLLSLPSAHCQEVLVASSKSRGDWLLVCDRTRLITLSRAITGRFPTLRGATFPAETVLGRLLSCAVSGKLLSDVQ